MERYETRRIKNLGIVAGVCREIGLIEQVDGRVQASQRKVSCGQAVQAMVMNALVFSSHALKVVEVEHRFVHLDRSRPPEDHPPAWPPGAKLLPVVKSGCGMRV